MLKWFIMLAGITVIAIVFLTFSNKDAKAMAQDNAFPSQVKVAFGQSGASLEQQYGDLTSANKKNFGLNFYYINADSRGKTMRAIIKTGTLETVIPQATLINAAEDRDRKVGINNLLITAKVKEGGMQPHPIAHQYVLNLIQSLRKTGWRYYISETKPRLKGKAALDYFTQNNIDPDYPLSFEQWMALPAPLTWEFYADHTYLTLQVDRDVNHLDPAKPGAYFISLTFTPREETERLGVDEKDRDHWRDTWVKRNLAFRALRNIKEAKLRAQGVPIDTDYKDPPLPPPPAGQQNPVIPDALK
ncbi:hypothetical protein [Vogesella sp. LIG4]|uniref:hypothetical protein n=1 Tax=Vogesella sp. LIG4 TaxID=1192162 RepID=UPI00081F9FDC|nr:hypothetical protein [Vogesella sp. LIG4]SCK08710.1 hypothetical protein PSELUDRAFT_0542 [Vogesella sp. LIG4]